MTDNNLIISERVFSPLVTKKIDDSEYLYFYGIIPRDVDLRTVSQIQFVSETDSCFLTTPCASGCDKKHFEKGEAVHIIARRIDKNYDARHFFSDSLFSMILVRTRTLTEAINKMTQIIDNGIDMFEQFKLFTNPKSENDSHPFNPLVRGRIALSNKFDLIKETIPEDAAATVHNWFKNPVNSCRDNRKIELFLNCNSSYKYRPKDCTAEEISNILGEMIYGYEDVVETLTSILVKRTTTADSRSTKILIAGPSGVGKTLISKAYIKASGLLSNTKDLSMVSSALDCKGCVSYYDGSDAGFIVKDSAKFGTTEQVFLLENLDCLQNRNGDKDGNPMQCLSSILGSEKIIRDDYLDGVPVSLENTDFICTATTLDTIPKTVIDSFGGNIIRLNALPFKQRVEIAKNKIIPLLIKTSGLNDADISFDDDILLYLAHNYCSDDGVGDLKIALLTIIGDVASSIRLHGETPVINTEYVDKLLSCHIDEEKPGLILNRYYDDFSSEVIDEIRKTIARTESPLISEGEKCTELRRLDYLLKMRRTAPKPIDIDKFIEEIENSHFGMEKAKEAVIESFKTQNNFNAIRSYFLVGPAGTGKTTLARSIAKASGKDFKKISLNAISEDQQLRGFQKTFKDSDGGDILKAVTSSSDNVVILMDELDKLNSKFINCCLDLIDEYSFTDQFVGVPLDLSNVIFIFTANSVANVSPYLYDRFDVKINVEGYSKKEKEQIIKHYILPELNKDFNLNVSIADSACETLLNEYSFTNGVRDIKSKINNLVRHILAQTDKTDFTITTEDIEAYFDKPMPRGNVPNENNGESGIALGLAVSGSEGIVFPVETTLIPNDSSLTVTGLAGEDVTESAELCATYIRSKYGKLRDEGIHVHYGEGAVKKSGPSAGVTTMISMLSAAFDIPVSYDYAYTGEIDLKGNVFAIGGIEKLEAAMRQGCKTVFIPRDNYIRWNNEGKLDEFDIEIVPVTHVSEVIKRVLPEICTQNGITK